MAQKYKGSNKQLLHICCPFVLTDIEDRYTLHNEARIYSLVDPDITNKNNYKNRKAEQIM